MRKIAAALVPLALMLAACETPPYDDPYGQSGYPPAPYPEPYPEPYPPAPYPPAPYPEPYPPAPYPEPYPPAPGGPIGIVPNPLAGTNWRVVAINGRPTPPGNYAISFEERRLNARFGCNSIGAGYSWDGTTVDAGAVLSTRMACSEPAMSYEAEGLRILELPMLSHWRSGERINLSNSAGSIDLARN